MSSHLVKSTTIEILLTSHLVMFQSLASSQLKTHHWKIKSLKETIFVSGYILKAPLIKWPEWIYFPTILKP
jgi:hypothetical protein